MNVKMMNFLSTFGAGICNNTKTTFGVRLASLLMRQLRRKDHHASQQFIVLRPHLRH